METIRFLTERGNVERGTDKEPAYEIDYSRVLPNEEGAGDDGIACQPLPYLSIAAQISLLEAYLYLGGAEFRGI